MAGEFNRECMTGVKDPGIGSSLVYDPEAAMETWNAYRDVLAARRAHGARVRTLAQPATLDEAQKLIRLIEPLELAGTSAVEDRLVSGGVKMFADGSGAARTAWMWQDWNRDGTGIDAGNPAIRIRRRPDTELIFLITTPACMSACTQSAIARSTGSSIPTRCAERKPVKGLRHSIIHSNIPSDHALDAMAAMQKRL